MSQRKAIFKDAGIYSISSYIAQVLDVVNGVLVRRFLGPENIGVWTFLQVIQNYAKHSGMGVTMATARDVPYFLQKGDEQRVGQIKNLVFTFTVLTSLLTAIVISAIAFFNRHHYSKPVFYGLFVVSGLLVLQRIYNLFVVIIRSHKQFVFAGVLNIFSSVVSVLLTVALTWKFQLYGFFAAMILNYVFNIGLIFVKTPYRFSLYLNRKDLMSLLGLGAAVLASDILRSLLTSIDRLVITKYLGFEQLGIYSVALMADNYLYTLPNMLGVVFFPHFQEAFAKRDNPEDLKKYLMLPILTLTYFFPFIIGFVWIVSAWFVPIVLPQYTAGIPALKILSLGALFLALTHSFTTYFITIRKHWNLIPITLGAILFGLAANFIAIRAGWGLEGVAAAESLTGLAYFILLSAGPLLNISGSRAMAACYLKVAVVAVYSGAVLYGLDYFLADSGGFIKVLKEFSLFCILMLPVALAGEKETGVFSTLRHMIAGKFGKKKSENA